MICSHPSPDPIRALTDQALEELCRPPVLPVNPDSPEIPRVLSVPQLAQVLHIGRNAAYSGTHRSYPVSPHRQTHPHSPVCPGGFSVLRPVTPLPKPGPSYILKGTQVDAPNF